jgi:hypothetical protein
VTARADYVRMYVPTTRLVPHASQLHAPTGVPWPSSDVLHARPLKTPKTIYEKIRVHGAYDHLHSYKIRDVTNICGR